MLSSSRSGLESASGFRFIPDVDSPSLPDRANLIKYFCACVRTCVTWHKTFKGSEECPQKIEGKRERFKFKESNLRNCAIRPLKSYKLWIKAFATMTLEGVRIFLAHACRICCTHLGGIARAHKKGNRLDVFVPVILDGIEETQMLLFRPISVWTWIAFNHGMRDGGGDMRRYGRISKGEESKDKMK